MRRLEWSAMDEAARMALCARGLAVTFEAQRGPYGELLRF